MIRLLILCALLSGCATARPKTNTPAPALDGTRRATTDAKDFLSRAKNTNTQIDQELDQLEKELDTP